MNLNTKDAVGFLTFEMLESYNFFKHAFSTRIGGVSKGCFKSLNLGFNSSDEANNVYENHKIMFNAAGFDINSVVRVKQVHGNNIITATKDSIVSDLSDINLLVQADGIITKESGITLVTSHADCLPIYIISLEKKAVCLLHSGWRGTVNGISKNAINKMCFEFGCNKDKILCAIGPSIGYCCFEVDYEVYEHFYSLKNLDHSAFIRKKSNGKFNINLSEVTRQMLIESGIKNENIIISDICTCCSSDLLFSHRASKGKRGTMIAMLSMNK